MSYRTYRHPIYRSVSATCCDSGSGPSNCDLFTLYDNMAALLNSVKVLVPTNRTTLVGGDGGVVSSLTATMSAQMGCPPMVIARLSWVKQNPGVIFNRNNCLHVIQLYGVYNELGIDWRYDPLAPKMVECLEAVP